MIMIRRKLYEYLMTASLETRVHKTFLFTVRLLLLANDEKLLKQFLYAYGESTNSFNDSDIKFLLIGIEKQPLRVEALLARIYLFKHFGYYYSDEQFETEEKLLFKQIKECIESNYALNVLIKPMLESMSENKYRVSADKIKEACAKYDGPLPEYAISASGIMVLCKACDKYLELLYDKKIIRSLQMSES